MKYDLIICGGTFDRLHKGHRAFLEFAFSKGENVVIGLTSDAYVKINKPASDIEPFVKREETLEKFLQEKGLLSRAKIVAIDSKFDQTQIPSANKSALLVSEETYPNGVQINNERRKNNLDPLDLIVFPLVVDNMGKKISSTDIRKTLFLSDTLRQMLHKPFGNLFTSRIPHQFLKDSSRIITIGDASTKRLHKEGVQQKVSVVDFLVERRKTNESLSELGFLGKEKIIHLVNPPGQLSSKIWKKMVSASKELEKSKNIIFVVEGEEDLLVIPCILLFPLGFYIFYGQPSIENEKEGIVILEITSQLKQQALEILRQFSHK